MLGDTWKYVQRILASFNLAVWAKNAEFANIRDLQHFKQNSYNFCLNIVMFHIIIWADENFTLNIFGRPVS